MPNETTGPFRQAAPTSGELQATIRFLARLERDGFYGHVHIAYQNGKILNVKQERQFRPSELPKG